MENQLDLFTGNPEPEIINTEVEKEISKFNKKGIYKSSTLHIARWTGKLHRHVLRDVRDYKDKKHPVFNSEKDETKVGPVKYKDKKGEYRDYYQLTYEQALLMIMRYNTPSAIQMQTMALKALTSHKTLSSERYKLLKGTPNLTDEIKNTWFLLYEEHPKPYIYAKVFNWMTQDVTGYTASFFIQKIKDDFKIDKPIARDFFNEETLKELNESQAFILMLLKRGYKFNDIPLHLKFKPPTCHYTYFWKDEYKYIIDQQRFSGS